MPEHSPLPAVLATLPELAARATDSGAPGAVWQLGDGAGGDRQLDANCVHLPAGHGVGCHLEPDVDVLLVVVAGAGSLASGAATDAGQPLAPGMLAWLPRGTTRALRAGPHGLSYLTVHRRRTGLRVRPRPPG